MMISGLGDLCLKAMATAGSPVATTLTEYDRIYRQFIAFVLSTGNHDELRSFTPHLCEEFMAYLGAQGASQNTIRHKLSALSTLARYGLQHRDSKGHQYLHENPLLAFKWPKRQRTRKEFLLPDELRAFLAVPRPVNEAIARDLLVDTGLRVSELCRANVEHFVRLVDGWVLYVTVKGEGRQDELVPAPISSPVAETLVAYLDVRPVVLTRLPKGRVPLLLNSRGERWSRYALGVAMKRIGRAAGIERINVSPHKLRRTSNIVSRYGGNDSLTRSRLLNHLSPSTIREYDAVIPGELSAAREQAREVGLRRYLGGEK
jgi:site-specific recombinase XerD